MPEADPTRQHEDKVAAKPMTMDPTKSGEVSGIAAMIYRAIAAAVPRRTRTFTSRERASRASGLVQREVKRFAVPGRSHGASG